MKRVVMLILILVVLVSCQDEDSMKAQINEDIQVRYTQSHEESIYTDEMKVIGMISKYTGDPFLDTLMTTAQSQLSEAGFFPLLKSPNSYLDPIDAQFEILNEFILSEVDGIIVIPNHETALNELIAEASRQGICVVIVDTPVDLEDLVDKKADLDHISFVVIDNYEAAFQALKTYGTLVDRSLDVLLVNGDLNNPNAIARMKGFKDAMAVSPNLHLTSEVTGAWQENLAYEVVLAELNRPKNYDLIVCANDRMAFGALEAVKMVGAAEKIRVTGFDGTPDGLEMVDSGMMEFTVAQCPEDFGRQASQAIISLINDDGSATRYIDCTLQMRGSLNDKLN